MNGTSTDPGAATARDGVRGLVRLKITAFVSLAICVMALGLTLIGLLPVFEVGIVTAYCAAGNLVLSWLIRSGRTARVSDPAGIFANHLFLVSILLLGCVLIPQDRSAALQLFLLIWAFDVPLLSGRQLTTAGLVAIVGELAIVLASTPGDRETLHGILLAIAMTLLYFPVLVATGHTVRGIRRQQLGQRAALAVALAQLRTLSERDALTGVSNRRHALDMLGNEAARQDRSGTSFSLAMLDLDFFKRINDAHGHAVGDGVLIGTARQLGATLPEHFTIARWGGEEFLVVMPETSSAAAADWMHRSRLGLVAQDWTDCAPGLLVDVSVGVCEHRAGDPIETTLARADAALYQAKAQGRGRVVQQSD